MEPWCFSAVVVIVLTFIPVGPFKLTQWRLWTVRSAYADNCDPDEMVADEEDTDTFLADPNKRVR